MIHMMAQYSIRADRIAEVRQIIQAFVAAVKRNETDTLRYESFQLWDTSSFVHVMTFADEAAEERHRTAAYTRDFVDALYPHCDRQPEFRNLSLIASAKG
jgi:quinol monooxygenase YgiN